MKNTFFPSTISLFAIPFFANHVRETLSSAMVWKKVKSRKSKGWPMSAIMLDTYLLWVQWRVEALMSNLEYDHPVIVRGFIIKTYDGAPSTGHDSFLLNSYALHLNYLKYHRILSNNQEGVCPSLQHTFSITTMDSNSFWITI